MAPRRRKVAELRVCKKPADPELVTFLEERLEQARSGEMLSMVCVYETRTAYHYGARQGWSDETRLLGMAERLKVQINKLIDG